MRTRRDKSTYVHSEGVCPMFDHRSKVFHLAPPAQLSYTPTL